MDKLIEGKDYDLVMADECFDDDNGGLIYGIHWLDDEDGEVEPYVCECQWFRTEEERQEVIDCWYANTQDTTPEQ